MTVDDYYIEVDKLVPPEGLNPFEEADWFRAKVNKVKAKLSKEVLAVVLEQERSFYRKMNSSVA